MKYLTLGVPVIVHNKEKMAWTANKKRILEREREDFIRSRQGNSYLTHVTGLYEKLGRIVLRRIGVMSIGLCLIYETGGSPESR